MTNDHILIDFGNIFQEFQDDVEYIVEGLNAKHRIPLRCLTAISLASKCMTPNFRFVHLYIKIIPILTDPKNHVYK